MQLLSLKWGGLSYLTGLLVLFKSNPEASEQDFATNPHLKYLDYDRPCLLYYVGLHV